LSLYIKISDYFTINKITAGFFIAFLTASAIYLDWFGIVNYLINTILGLMALYFLLQGDKKVWTWTGFWTGILWFWWMAVSFINYEMSWAIPISLIVSGIIYALIFWLGIHLVYLLDEKLKVHILIGKVAFLLMLSYLHPFGFDWYKPELMFTNSYLGIEKWQFLIVLVSISLAIYKNQLLYFLLILLAYPYNQYFQEVSPINKQITLYGTHTNVHDKWNENLREQHIQEVFLALNQAIKNKQKVIVFPESVFALFLNTQAKLMNALVDYSKHITIIVGGLSWEENIPRNSTFIFQDKTFRIANKVKLVPFGEENPLPSWMGKWINDIFFDGAPDYVAASDFTDYRIGEMIYRNAICFEATSEKLYEGKPKNMIVLSNNGWLTPSIEPTQQKILLQYYSKKYGTTIYHAVNMSPSYIIHQGKVKEVQ
jgi:apolipoprotein N-acyltransferase